MPHHLHITGFDSSADADAFGTMVEFARHGRVICGWREPDSLEIANGLDDGEPFPVYDDRDRSDDPRYPLAEMLVTCGCLEITELDTQPGYRALMSFDPAVNRPLLDDAARRSGLTVSDPAA